MTSPRTDSPPERRAEAPQPSTPMPEDPREREPIHDPPVDPEHDIEQDDRVRQAGGPVGDGPHSGEVVFDGQEPER